MSTGPDSSGRHRAAPLASSDVDSLAEVFNRFTLDSARRQRQSTEEPDTATTAQPPAPPWPAAESRSEASSSGTDPSEEHVTATSIRPYAWTGGRTRSNHQLELETLVNGETRQLALVKDLVFDIPELISTISAGTTLLPGDVLATGTPAGVGIGFDPPRFLRSGDVVEITVSGLGRLRNRIA